MARVRADVLLLERGLVESRETARRLIMAGRARAGSQVLVKPSTLLDRDAQIELLASERYVSRGGLKLEAALEQFRIDVTGLSCLDLGASTGGFTDCLLQRGASLVVAVDVGRGQLHSRLRGDSRVHLLEEVNARALPALPPTDFFVADLSFISLRLVLPSVQQRVLPSTMGAVLFKPQFEAERYEVPRGGVIRDERVRSAVLARFLDWAESNRWRIADVMLCPVAGREGNREFFLKLQSPPIVHGDRSC